MHSLPTHVIFANIKQALGVMDDLQSPLVYYASEQVINAYELELERRMPEPYLEYDQDGHVIINEVIGFTDEGKEIWILSPNQ